MERKISLFSLLGLLAVSTMGCVSKQAVANVPGPDRFSTTVRYVGTDYVVVKKRPPAPRREVRSRRISSRHVWVGGRWAWRGNRYVWVSGTWEKPPRSGARWVDGHWAKLHGGWVYVAGHWKYR